MENMIFCQSCGMPLAKDEDYGTNKDGSKNQDYCVYCFKEGKYTNPGETMENMIEFCIPHVVEANKGMTPEEARKSMQEWFPKLKRWKVA